MQSLYDWAHAAASKREAVYGGGLGRLRLAISEKASEEKLAPAEPQTSREEQVTRPTPDAELLSPNTTAAVGSAFSRLTEITKKNEPSLEDFARELLRPMLQAWLDENLSGIVEGMVRAEIERATRGR